MDGVLRIKANECGYKEEDRMLKNQFINHINDENMMTEIIKRVDSSLKRNSESLLSAMTHIRRIRHDFLLHNFFTLDPFLSHDFS